MSRVPGLERHEVPESIQRIYDADMLQRGRVGTSTKVRAHWPEFLAPLKELFRAAEVNDLDERIATLGPLRAAQLIGCPF